MHLRSVLMAILVAAAGGCATNQSVVLLSPDGPTSVGQDPVPVVWAASDVFERVGIPVAEEDQFEGEVRSGTFRVERVWGGEAVEARIRCGADDRGFSPADHRFEVSVNARIRAAGAQTTRVLVWGSVTPLDRSDGEELDLRCGLREEFRGWLEEEIGRAAQRLPPRHRIMRH